MKKYLIARTVPGAGSMTEEELQAISKTSVTVISVMGKPYNWVHSFVTESKIYCIHQAENEADIKEHSQCGNLPIDSIEEIRAELDLPSTL